MNAEQKESLRIAVLNFLAPRHVAAFRPGDIRERLLVARTLDFSVTDADVAEACDLLVKLELVSAILETAVSVIPYYQATGKGVIESEKWRAARGIS
jgi:hypothetical protein